MSIPFIKAKSHKNPDGTYTVKVYHREGVVTEVHFANAAFAERMAQQYADFMNDTAESIRKFEVYMKEDTYEEPKPEELRAVRAQQEREQAISFAMANANLDREEKGEEPISKEVFEQAYDELHPAEAPAPVVMGADVSLNSDEATVSLPTPVAEDEEVALDEVLGTPVQPESEPDPIAEAASQMTPEEAAAPEVEEPTETPGVLNPEQADAAQAAFDATPEQLGEAAVSAAQEAPAEEATGKKKGKRK